MDFIRVSPISTLTMSSSFTDLAVINNVSIFLSGRLKITWPFVPVSRCRIAHDEDATLRLTDSGVNAVGGGGVGKFFAGSLCSP
jgi:hypothetical protein